jgi:eukaryotic-like serine/threonine-protein kinase
VTRLLSSLKVGRRVGGGHFGDVHEGDDPAIGRVAVKVIKPKPTDDAAYWQLRKDNLLKEAQTLQKAQHDNVVRVYHVLESPTDDAIHMVMEFCDGGSLQPTYERGPMSLADVQRIITGVSMGLEALHSRGMIHRDIKPGNILIDGRGCARLGDFGLVTDDIILGYAAGAGYTDHLAPEVFSARVTSVKTDIWALGMTIFRLLHGKEWCERRSHPPSILIPRGGFADTLKWLPHIPKRWRRLVREMLSDDPADRPQSASQVTNAFASLPTMPRWECDVAGTRISWVHTSATRRVEVVSDQHSAHRFTWEATSHPLGPGRKRRLGGSAGKIGRAQFESELRAFFARFS